MFYPIENGSVFEVKDNCFGFVYLCQLPPVGYGKNIMTGEIEKTDILQRSDIPEEQYFQRIPLPFDFKEKRKREQIRQQTDKSYVDPYLEDFRTKDWHRRLCGVWVMIFNTDKGISEPVYLTGQHWLYCNWWIYQGKYMDYREPDRETFYVCSYCQEDPKNIGLNEITQRKSGKTGRSGCVAYERTSRLANHHCGIQSKTDTDGFTMFKKAIVHPWRKLPHFYRPIYDLMKGDDPNELRFFATSRRGQNAEIEEQEEALESFIDFGSSEEGFYDGPELKTWISDESGKTRRTVSIKERFRVVRESREETGGDIDNFFWSTTTVEVEKDESENVEFQEFTAESNPLVRDDNGMTISGYYTIFQPCTKYMYFNKYGRPDEAKALEYIQNRRNKLKDVGDTRGLSSYKRKKPITFKEAFSADGQYTLYDPELINNQLDEISWDTQNHLTEKGNLKWKDGYKIKRPKLDEAGREIVRDGKTEFEPNEVIWVVDPNGKFEKVVGWWPKNPNNVIYDGRNFKPNNNYAYRVGCDPFKYDKTKDRRRSNCAAFAYQMPDRIFKSDFDDMFVLRYAYRESSTRAANEDVLMMAWLCGCEALFERNINHWKDHFEEWKVPFFLMWLPDEVEPGVITTGGSVQTVCDYTESYINKHIKKVYFKTLLQKNTGWLGFKVEDTETFDEPMGAGVTLIAVNNRKYRDPNEKVGAITDYFRKRKVA